ncbi:phosphoribosylformylglycinamidine cyclo-ligase [Subtercola sp. PAMC28395]|uniref:phosphoribosylformylglycinamidine cyclo-ligase n=1 Tax=Subtercola sp. PAMC28395 TaxID=2846775 RepID=UPI001C0C8FE2|nr:phosphoribosylformylglycinamidine cyclo-ligase [Subtercola sp. PAMC28395]QWT24797.1 phosphoribosylformylglycinamidine cyclo-ligase [Subtercola sp. PAMC28395]
MTNSYAAAGVDTAAGDLAVELMKAAVSRTHGPNVFGGFGGFAGMFDVSPLKAYTRPLLATSTDGVGTKVAIAQALDKHDTIGQDLVGMVVDDIVVVGAKPLFMTDYIACGKVVPSRIADIVAGIARACADTGTALIGGETAEHPGLLGPDDYDVAGAATGVVEADALLGPDRVADGDVVLALESSGLHSNGFSLVRHILAGASVSYTSISAELGGVVGEALLEPTRLYTLPLLRLLGSAGPQGFDGAPEAADRGAAASAAVTSAGSPVPAAAIHSISHVTGGGIAANLARVLPLGSWVEVDRSTWSPLPVFRVLGELAGSTLESAEGTWNLGIGMILVVDPRAAAAITAALEGDGIHTWQVGVVSTLARDFTGFEQGAKGVDGGAVRLVGAYAG